MKLSDFKVNGRCAEAAIGYCALFYAARRFYGIDYATSQRRFKQGELPVDLVLHLDSLSDKELSKIPKFGPATISNLRTASKVIREQMEELEQAS